MDHYVEKLERTVSSIKKIVKTRQLLKFVESISNGTNPCFLIRSEDRVTREYFLNTRDELFVPHNLDELPYPQYQESYTTLEELDKEKLLNQIKNWIDQTLVLKEDDKLFILGTIFASYCLDWMDSVHYLAFIGDISTGKSTILKLLQHLMYRPLYTTQISDWQILKFLGTENDCNGVVLIDECQNIEKNRNLHDIFKQGYKKNNPISKGGIFYNTFTIYCLAGERLVEDRAIRDRLIPIHTTESIPQIQLSKVTDNQLKSLNQLRNDLLMWKLYNLTRPVKILKEHPTETWKDEDTGEMYSDTPDPETEPIQLDIKLTGRERELFEDYFILLHGTKYYEPYKQAVLRFLEKRKSYSFDTFEAKLWREISSVLKNNKLILSDLDHVRESESFDKPSKKKLVKIIKEKFGGNQDRKENQRFYKFDSNNIESFDKKYGVN